MAKIYKRSDRITVKIDDIVVKLAPMSMHQKAEVQTAMVKGYKSLDIRESTRGLGLAIKYAVKGIDGVVDTDGNQYKLQFEGDDPKQDLTDDCLDDLMNLELSTKLSQVCSGLLKGVQSEFKDTDDKALAGVEIVKVEPVGKP